MPINPKRVVTTPAKKSILNGISLEDTNGTLVGAKAFLVTDIVVDSFDTALSGIVLGNAGMQTGVACGEFSDAVVSESGKVYSASELLVYTCSNPTGAQSFKGVVLSPTNNATDAFVYLEFDEPIGVSENGETIELKVEYGFDGLRFYIVPRVIELGE